MKKIELDETTNALLEDVDKSARIINAIRPFTSSVLESIQHELLVERVSASTAIEGNTLDLRETREILRTGHVDIPKKREATEQLNLKKAIDYIQDNLIDVDKKLTIEEFLKVHNILLTDINDAQAGAFRDKQVMIQAAKHQPPDSSYISGFLEKFFYCLNQPTEKHPVLLASWGHWYIARIHPFFDGNGRMARLWQDILLFRNKLTSAVIHPDYRKDYLSALEAADEGDFNPLTQLIAQCVSYTFDKTLSVYRQDEEIEKWAEDLNQETDARTAQERKLDYIRWVRMMELVCFEFERCTSRMNQTSRQIEIQMWTYDLIDQSTWESIRSGISPPKTGFINLSFRRNKKYLRYRFFFGKHIWKNEDTEDIRSEPRVTLLVSEQLGYQAEWQRLGDHVETPLTLKELFVVDKKLVRRRYDHSSEKFINDRDVKPLQVAQDFIQEVLLQIIT